MKSLPLNESLWVEEYFPFFSVEWHSNVIEVFLTTICCTVSFQLRNWSCPSNCKLYNEVTDHRILPIFCNFTLLKCGKSAFSFSWKLIRLPFLFALGTKAERFKLQSSNSHLPPFHFPAVNSFVAEGKLFAHQPSLKVCLAQNIHPWNRGEEKPGAHDTDHRVTMNKE